MILRTFGSSDGVVREEKGVTRATAAFGCVHGVVGAVHQPTLAVAMFWIDGDTDARCAGQGMAFNQEGCAQIAEDFSRDGCGILLLSDAVVNSVTGRDRKTF